MAFREGKAALRERFDDPVARAHVLDAPVAHGDSAVEDRGGGDRDDHAGGPDDHVAHGGAFQWGTLTNSVEVGWAYPPQRWA